MTRDGFTLLEILVVLAVFGLLLVGLSQGLHYGVQAWRTQMRMTQAHGDLNEVDSVVRHIIEVMAPGHGTDPAPMTGGRDVLAMVTELPSAGQVEASLLVDPRHRLVLSWRLYRHAQRLRAAAPPTTEVLATGVSGAEFSFWRPTGGWQPVWNGPDLPALIRVRLTFPPGDLRHWPDIVAAPLLGR
jgi:general secretion pathway protein J